MPRAKSAGGLAVESGHDHDDVACSPLAALLQPEGAGDELAAPQEALDALAVLQVLEDLNRCAAGAQVGGRAVDCYTAYGMLVG
jgi:hypothetical protein